MEIFDEWMTGVEFLETNLHYIEKEIDDDEANGEIIFPVRAELLSNLKVIRPSSVRVVIIGSHPYRSPYALGVPFAAIGKTDTLHEIDIEMQLDCGQYLHDYSLSRWIEQGVLILNEISTMSTKRKHSWKGFVDSVLDFIDSENLVICAMGPQDNISLINRKASVVRAPDPQHHLFHGSRIFTNINNNLLLLGQKPIEWGRTNGLYGELVRCRN